MKKSIIIVGIIAFTLTSCASSGWSCKKRYCETTTEKVNYQLQKSAITEINCEVATR